MKSGAAAVLVAVLLPVIASCTRPAPAPEKPALKAAADTQRSRREALFGQEALGTDVNWTSNGLGYRITDRGTPPTPGIGAEVKIRYTGRLKDGSIFDRPGKPAGFFVGSTIRGLSSGLVMLGTGGKATLFIPPELGYGSRKVMGIPPNSGLIFDVEVVEIGR